MSTENPNYSRDSSPPRLEFTPLVIGDLKPRRVGEENIWIYDSEVGGEVEGKYFILTEGGQLEATELAVEKEISPRKPGFLRRPGDGWLISIEEGWRLSATPLFGSAQKGNIKNIYVLSKPPETKFVLLEKPTRGRTTSVLAEEDIKRNGIALIPVRREGGRGGGVLITSAGFLRVRHNARSVGGLLGERVL